MSCGGRCGGACCGGPPLGSWYMPEDTPARFYGAPCEEIEDAPGGRSFRKPCGTTCGPLDVDTWIGHAQAYIDAVPSHLLDASEAERLRNLQRELRDLPGGVASPFTWAMQVDQAVSIAQSAACLTRAALERGAKPGGESCPPNMEWNADAKICVPRIGTEDPSEPWTWPSVPGWTWPSWPSWSIPWWVWAIVAGVAVWWLSSDEQQQRRRKLRRLAPAWHGRAHGGP